MIPNSPLDYLIAFAIAFILGVVWTLCFGCYANKIRREAAPHA
jgi:hypothetical protein